MSRSLIIGRHLESLQGELLTKRFTVNSSLGPIPIETKDIAWIHFEGLPHAETDEIWKKNGDRLIGQVVVETATVNVREVVFRPLGGTVMEISFDRIHTILANVDPWQ